MSSAVLCGRSDTARRTARRWAETCIPCRRRSAVVVNRCFHGRSRRLALILDCIHRAVASVDGHLGRHFWSGGRSAKRWRICWMHLALQGTYRDTDTGDDDVVAVAQGIGEDEVDVVVQEGVARAVRQYDGDEDDDLLGTDRPRRSQRSARRSGRRPRRSRSGAPSARRRDPTRPTARSISATVSSSPSGTTTTASTSSPGSAPPRWRVRRGARR